MVNVVSRRKEMRGIPKVKASYLFPSCGTSTIFNDDAAVYAPSFNVKVTVVNIQHPLHMIKINIDKMNQRKVTNRRIIQPVRIQIQVTGVNIHQGT